MTIADISPVGLTLAKQRAADAGVTLNVLQIDLQEQPLVAEPFDLIVSVCYLWRPLFAEYPRLLTADGTLVVIQPTLRNLERNAEAALRVSVRTRGSSCGWPTGLKLSTRRKAGWATGGTTRYWWPANRSLAGL